MQATDADKALPLGARRLAGAQKQQHKRRRRQRRQHPPGRQHPPVLARRPPMAAAAARVHHAVPPIRRAAAPAHAWALFSCGKPIWRCSFEHPLLLKFPAQLEPSHAPCTPTARMNTRRNSLEVSLLRNMLAAMSARTCAEFRASCSACSTDQQPDGGSAVRAQAVSKGNCHHNHRDARMLTCVLCR